ncbi:MAG: CHAP domain-containing protein, partial [Oenococcus sicerae]|uniref:CHAP domain-containing protein n=1 Tax=Oenococcus sicerae TaxID=2203724 RepID=UPI0039E79475
AVNNRNIVVIYNWKDIYVIKRPSYPLNKIILTILSVTCLVLIPVAANAADTDPAKGNQPASIYFSHDAIEIKNYQNKQVQNKQNAIKAEQAAIEAAKAKQQAAAKQESQRQKQAVNQNSHNTTVTNGANTYAYATCTWYVKNSLPWVPNTLGDAANWAVNAAAQGYLVNSSPSVGSVVVFAPGQATAGAAGHVAVVTAVNGDGSITISEGNFAGLASNIRLVANASSYRYIHP